MLGATHILVSGTTNVWALYTVSGDRWETVPSPPANLGFLIALDAQRALAGSTSIAPQTPPVKHVFIFDLASRQWRRTADTTGVYYGPSGESGARLSDGRVLMVNTSSFHDLFDPVAETWTRVPFASFLDSQRVVALPGGKALVLGTTRSAIFDGASGIMTVLPGSRVGRHDFSATLLPSGKVLVAGGRGRENVPMVTALLVDPADGSSRVSGSLQVPRANPATALLSNGQLVFFGGLNAYYQNSLGNGIFINLSEYTRSVESYAWEPEISRRLPAGSYTATVTQDRKAQGGFWGIEAHTSGPLDGGVNFGGMLGGDRDRSESLEPGFGAFFLPTAQTARIRVSLQSPFAAAPAAVARIKDGAGNVVAGPFNVQGSGEFSAPLAAGFYVVDLLSVPDSNDSSFQISVSASQLSSGGSVGGLIDPFFAVTGFVNFYLSSEQDVRLRLLNRGTYGEERGAGEVILTLLDSTGRVVARSGPGAITPPP